jgi:hypothetical protein
VIGRSGDRETWEIIDGLDEKGNTTVVAQVFR